MLKAEEWIRVREMGRQGVSLSEIARQTGHDRKTIRKVIGLERATLVQASTEHTQPPNESSVALYQINQTANGFRPGY